MLSYILWWHLISYNLMIKPMCWKINVAHRIWGFYRGGYEQFYLQGYNAMYPLKVNWRFRGTCCLQGQRTSQAKKRSEAKRSKAKQTLLATCFMLVSWLILQPWKWKWHVPPKCQLSFNGLHGVISQNTETFIIVVCSGYVWKGITHRGSLIGKWHEFHNLMTPHTRIIMSHLILSNIHCRITVLQHTSLACSIHIPI
jgi:hypothetical protein